MTKKEIASAVAVKLDIHPDHALAMVQATLDTMADAFVAGNGIELRNFGIFTVKRTAAKVGQNPRNVESGPVHIPARTVIKFKMGKELAARMGETHDETENVEA